MFSLKSLPFILGFLAILTMTRFTGYGFPYGITGQYIYLLVPFLFIGTIDVLSGRSFIFKIPILYKRIAKEKVSHKHSRLKKYKLNKKKAPAYAMITIIILLALFFEPFGPFNGIVKGTSFNLQQDLDVNMTDYQNVIKLVSTVPSADPYVVIQNGLPEFFPRSYSVSGDPMTIPGIFEVPSVGHSLSYNLSYENSKHQWKKIRIDYVIADPYQSTYFESDPYHNNLSMCQLVRELYTSWKYGIYAEIDGMIVLKHNYSGTPKYYQKFSTVIHPSELISSYFSGRIVSSSNTSATGDQWIHLWKTPQLSISPGKYEINISYSYENPTDNRSMYSLILSTSGSTEANETIYNFQPGSLGIVSKRQTLNLYVNIKNFTNQFEVFAQIDPGYNWVGSFNIYRVSIQQVKPPNT